MQSNINAVVIGGSAGSFQGILEILENLPHNFPIPIFITLHRLKQVRNGLLESVSFKSHLPIVEPFDRDPIKPGFVYIAPANYHLYVQDNKTISLSTEEVVEFSRPSIDVLFKSAAEVYGDTLLAIILSGANRDGAKGCEYVKQLGGTLIVQNPLTAEVSIMPKAALENILPDYIYDFKQIIAFLQKLAI